MAVTRRTIAHAATLGLLLPLLADTAGAQPVYPSKPIRLIIPYAPGGGTSVIARHAGQKLTES